MNPPLTFSAAKTQLNLLTSQTANFTFTDDEITQALQTAWNDTYVVNQVWDDTTSFVTGTWQYPIPATVTTVNDLYFKRTTSDFPERISPELYEIVNGNIQFTVFTPNWINDTYTLYIKGYYKLTTSDSLSTTNQINYVINLAAETLLNQLLLKKTFVFLTNDTSVGDISAALRVFQSNVLRFKQAILREFQSS